MTVGVSADGTIELGGVCTIEDAETLQRHLIDMPGATVDWRTCLHAHTAVIQVLIASRAKLTGPPTGEFLRTRLDPLLQPPST